MRDKWLWGIFFAALILYTFNLGELPLRDWDEGTVASVARNIWRSPAGSDVWLYPTIGNDRPYWNKPPLIHWLIALTYSFWGVSEWSTRLVPAILSALSVPLLYKIAREILPTHRGAIFAALVYLTLLPVVRHGRLAMLDGAVVCWFTLTIWCLLKARSQPQWFLGVGGGLGLICLTKGIMMGVLLGAIAIIFLGWDTPKFLKSSYLWLALVLGIIPALAWYGCQYLHYGTQFLGISLGEQTFNRIWQPVENNANPPWYFAQEMAKYTLPWLLFLPGGIKLAIRDCAPRRGIQAPEFISGDSPSTGKANRHQSWGKLTLIWGGLYFCAVSLMSTKLPWYIMPIYPAFALLVGANLDYIWQHKVKNLSYKAIIIFIFSLLAIALAGAAIYYGQLADVPEPDLQLIAIALSLTLTLAAVMLNLKSRYFILTSIAGLYISLLLLFNSNNWVWELAESYPVKPVAHLIAQNTPAQAIIYTSQSIHRPTLEFYSDRQIVIATEGELQQYWSSNKPVYFLVDDRAIARLNLESPQTLGSAISWQLITQTD